jgi:RHS repeat-associated protein
MARTGSTPNPYTFTARESDPDSGLMYYRARYYSPEVGRFITLGPWVDNIMDPLSLNRYIYTRNNPVNYIDPSGLFSWCALACGLACAIVCTAICIWFVNPFAIALCEGICGGACGGACVAICGTQKVIDIDELADEVQDDIEDEVIEQTEEELEKECESQVHRT